MHICGRLTKKADNIKIDLETVRKQKIIQIPRSIRGPPNTVMAKNIGTLGLFSNNSQFSPKIS